MKIVVSGATGFIGQALIRILASEKQDQEIVAAVRSRDQAALFKNNTKVTVQVADYTDEASLRSLYEGADVVIDLIGQMGTFGLSYEKYYDVNCRLTEKLVKAASEAGASQFIYCSTPGVQGFGRRLCKEDDPCAPRNPYEITKLIGEDIVRNRCAGSQMRYTIIRPDFVYGPGDTRRIKMYRMIRQGKFVLTTNGKAYLHPTYVDDVASGITACIGRPEACDQVFNLAAEKDLTVNEYLETIAAVTGGKIRRINIGYSLSVLAAKMIDGIWQKLFKKEGFVSKNKIDFLAIDHSSSIRKAQKLLGYKPEYSFRKGMKLTVDWMKENNLY